jgi:hypothetical protein
MSKNMEDSWKTWKETQFDSYDEEGFYRYQRIAK